MPGLRGTLGDVETRKRVRVLRDNGRAEGTLRDGSEVAVHQGQRVLLAGVAGVDVVLDLEGGRLRQLRDLRQLDLLLANLDAVHACDPLRVRADLAEDLRGARWRVR
eukprot:scaffold39122_cov21-Phaeocystis_antarctica.AAC.1